MDKNCCMDFGWILKKYRQSCDAGMEEYHFSPNEMDVLLYLSNNPTYNTARDICQRRGLSKSLVCRSVDSLTRSGYLSLESDRQDKRRIRLKLEERAEPVLERLQETTRQFHQALCKGIAPDDLEIFEKVLGKMAKNAEEFASARKK